MIRRWYVVAYISIVGIPPNVAARWEVGARRFTRKGAARTAIRHAAQDRRWISTTVETVTHGWGWCHADELLLARAAPHTIELHNLRKTH